MAAGGQKKIRVRGKNEKGERKIYIPVLPCKKTPEKFAVCTKIGWTESTPPPNQIK